jgi:NitT/TauT family transport system substrate-binding protein
MTSHSLPSRRAVLAGMAVSGLAAACDTNKSATTAYGSTRLRFATDWRAQAEQGGFYQAKATGLYEAAGLDVAIIQGGPNVNVPQLLAAEAIELGMISNSPIVLSSIAANAGLKVMMASFQSDPQVLLTHPRDDVNAIADMKGKPILLADASITAFWPWLKDKYGFTDDQVRKYTANSTPFIADKNAIQQGYITSEPFTIAEQGGFTPEVYLLAEAGYPSYGAMVAAQATLIEAQRAQLQAFVTASIAGWRSYLTGDPAPGDELITKDNPDMTPALLANARKALVERNIVIPASGPLGAMTEARWDEFTGIMKAAKVVPDTVDWRAGVDLSFVSG